MLYGDFLAARTQLDGDYGFEPTFLPEYLFDFQRALVGWAVRKGRGALFADCGLGKTPMQLVWAQNVLQRTGRPVLIATPLAVSFQVESEAAKFGIEAAVSRDGTVRHGITITNYDRLHLFEPAAFGGMICDESSAIKAFDGKRRQLVTNFMRKLRYRLLCTATAAPNDYVELGTSSEALGYLGYMDMLSRFFTNKQRTSKQIRGRFAKGHGAPGEAEGWRFKGHAEDHFWRWVSSWARAMRRPSDLGYSDERFVLPSLVERQHVVERDASRPSDDQLFDVPAIGLREERAEQRRTVVERVERAVALLADSDSAVAWCQLNDESQGLARLIDGAVEVRGSDSADAKEESLLAFSRGEARVLVTKPSIGAWGLNWQHCNRMTYFPSHSYEQYYQAVRRFWRFGQTRPVLVDIVTTQGGARALESLQRKSEQADRMFESLTEHMREALNIDRSATYDQEVRVPAWLTS